MRIDRIAAGDIVLAQIKGRSVHGEVTEIKDGVVLPPNLARRRMAPRQPPGDRDALAKDRKAHSNDP